MTTASREECTGLLRCIRFDDDDRYVRPLIVPQEKQAFSPAGQIKAAKQFARAEKTSWASTLSDRMERCHDLEQR